MKIKKQSNFFKTSFIAFILLLFFYPLNTMVVNAKELTKTIEVNIPQDYLQCSFYVSFEKEIVENTFLLDPSGNEYPFLLDDESGQLRCTLKDVKTGKYIVKITKDIPDEDESLVSDVPTDTVEVFETDLNTNDIGKVTVTVKAEEESMNAVTNELKLAKEISGLQIYWKDDSIVAEWKDETVGNVDITVINSKNFQILNNSTVKEQYYEYEVSQDVEEIMLRIVPATSNKVNGAGEEYIIAVNNHPDATIDFEPVEYTNKDTVSAVVTLGKSYSLAYYNNGEKVGETDTLSPGSHNVEVPTVLGNNDVKIYVVDENHNMRSTGITFIKDIEPPTLKIANDINGLSTYDESISFSGVVEDYDRLEFRGEFVTVDWDGLFEVNATLRDGENEIVLTAVDMAGNEAVYNAYVTKLVVEEKEISWNIIITSGGILFLLILFFIKRKYNLHINIKLPNGKKKGIDKNTDKTDYICLLISLIIYILLIQVVFQLANVKSSSMAPTIDTNEIILANKLAYTIKEPNRGDIITFNDDNSNRILLKRIIGLPGDEITFVDGYVFINGIICDESEYLNSEVETNSNQTFVVPSNCYFVLGDNRENSIDSRYWDSPYVEKSSIIGKLLLHIDIE